MTFFLFAKNFYHVFLNHAPNINGKGKTSSGRNTNGTAKEAASASSLRGALRKTGSSFRRTRSMKRKSVQPEKESVKNVSSLLPATFTMITSGVTALRISLESSHNQIEDLNSGAWSKRHQGKKLKALPFWADALSGDPQMF